MTTGGPLLADFEAGTFRRPEVPDVVGACLTTTADGRWVVWAYKVARRAGDMYRPLVGGEAYPVDAVATCRRDEDLRQPHDAPDPGCTCGFHALSQPWFIRPRDVVGLEVALSGRILAFEWPQGGVLLRSTRQTVMRIHPPTPGMAAPAACTPASDVAVAPTAGAPPAPVRRRPDDPHGREARRADQSKACRSAV